MIRRPASIVAGACASAVFGLALLAAVGQADTGQPPLHPNPRLDSNVAGWSSFQGSVSWQAGGFARVAYGSGGYVTFTDDGAPAVPSAQARPLHAIALVCASTGTTGETVQAKLRERVSAGGTVIRDVAGPAVVLGPAGACTTLEVNMTAPTAGRRIDFRISLTGADPGDVFLVDEVNLHYVSDTPPPNRAPTVDFSWQPPAPAPGEDVSFTATPADADDDPLVTTWDLDGDLAYDDATGTTASRSFETAGTYQVAVKTTDPSGESAIRAKDVTVADAPPPTPDDHFLNPFPNSPTRRDAATMPFDANSATLVNVAITNARQANSGRGPTVYGTGEARWRSESTDPLWTVIGGSVGGSTTINAPQNVGDSGGFDPTLGIYSPTKTVRLYCGASGSCSYDRVNRIIRGQNLGVDTNADGAPDQGIGTAWGRMSGEGLMLARELDGPDAMIKFANGNNDNARSFRPPARSFESKATGPAYPNGVPAGTVFCHVLTEAQVDGYQSAANLSGDILVVSEAFWDTTSCTRGKGMVLGDGTGTNGFNLYMQTGGGPGELPVSETQARTAVRMPAGGNAGGQASGAWANANWRALGSQ